MIFSGAAHVEVDPDVLWDALVDPRILTRCIPGCRSFNRLTPDVYAGLVRGVVGPLSASFAVRIFVEDVVYTRCVRLSGFWQGATAGFAKVTALVRLEPTSRGTELRCDGKLKAGGALAALGDEILNATINQSLSAFFESFVSAIERRREMSTRRRSVRRTPIRARNV